MKLLDQIRQRLQSCLAVQDEEQFLHDCFEDPLPITPWAFWTLFSLVNHRQRQEFVLTCVQQLGGDVSLISKLGNSGHPNIPGNGIVPHHKDWKFYFHGIGCCLTHRHSGEDIDVDFYDETANWFDKYFYLQFLKSLKVPQIWEQRVIDMHPSFTTVLLSIDELLKHGLLEKHEDRTVFRLAFPWETFNAQLQLTEDWLNQNHDLRIRLLSATAGDWELVQEYERDADLLQCAHTASQTIRSAREKYLLAAFVKTQRDPAALRGLFELGSDQFDNELRNALLAQPSGLVSTALDILIESKNGSWTGEVRTLLDRLDPNGEPPQPHIYLRCHEYLLHHSTDLNSLRDSLKKTGGISIADAAILALEFLPNVAEGLFQKALRSEIPLNRIVAASALALLDQPWSHQILLNALNESNDWEATIECRNAMRLLNNTDLHAAVDRWESDYCTAHKIQADELPTPKGHLNYEMKQLKDHVISLRNVFPPHGPE